MLCSLAVAVDLGDVSLIFQVVILFLLALSLPFVKRGRGSERDYTIHGYLTLLAVVVHSVFVFWIMVPSLVGGFSSLGELGILETANVWLHVALGTIAEVLGVVLVVSWFVRPRTEMACAGLRQWMLPTFLIWTVALAAGVLVHLLEMM